MKLRSDSIIEKPTFPMRINRYLALREHSTRRKADELIKKKQVFINGRLAVLGDKVQESDIVKVNFRGKPTPDSLSQNQRQERPFHPKAQKPFSENKRRGSFGRGGGFIKRLLD